jgi:hypothetical protein
MTDPSRASASEGVAEHGLVACLPSADHVSWGAPFEPCEGARLSFAADPPRFTDVGLIRVDGAKRLPRTVEPGESDAPQSLAAAARSGDSA